MAEQELFTLPELVKAFDMTGISKSPAIFDRQKLDHFNAVYLRGMAPEAFAKAAEPYIRQTVTDPRFDTAAIAALLQARCEKLTDIPEKVDFFDALPEYPVDYYTNKKSKTNPRRLPCHAGGGHPRAGGPDGVDGRGHSRRTG